METFEILLRIKEAVGDQVFADALALLHSTAPPRHPPDPTAPHPLGGLCKEEPTERRTKLPHNFHCDRGHVHPIIRVGQLLEEDVPKCLLRRIVLEWASLDEADDA